MKYLFTYYFAIKGLVLVPVLALNGDSFGALWILGCTAVVLPIAIFIESRK